MGGDDKWSAYGGGRVLYDFMDEVVARLGDEWRMSRSEILAWLDERRA